MILDRIPILNGLFGTRIRYAAAALLAIFGLVNIAILIYRGDAPPITSPDILRQVNGCYYLDGRMALVLSSDGTAHISGATVHFSVVSLKNDLNISPEGLLVVAPGPDGVRHVYVADGFSRYLPVRLAPAPTIKVTTLDHRINVNLEKGRCPGG